MQTGGTRFVFAAIGNQSALDHGGAAHYFRKTFLEFRRGAIGGRFRPRIVAGQGQQRSAGRLFRRTCGSDGRADDLVIALRVDRQFVVEIPGREAASFAVIFEDDLAASSTSP